MADLSESPQVAEGEDEPANSPTSPRQHGFIRRHWMGTTVAVLLCAPTLGFTIWAGIAMRFSYSEGTRTGFVQKLSKKGWICKTWEGEMAMTTQPGVAPVIFSFTVRLDSVADEITRLEGRQVTLWYKEHKGVPSSCFGETSHFVQRVGGDPR